MGLLDGLGGLSLVRDDSGEIVWGRGAWRPREGELGYDDLRELFRPGSALIYQGPAIDRTATFRIYGGEPAGFEHAGSDRLGSDDTGSGQACADVAGADAAGSEQWAEVRLEVEVTAVERCQETVADSGTPASLIRLEVRRNAENPNSLV